MEKTLQQTQEREDQENSEHNLKLMFSQLKRTRGNTVIHVTSRELPRFDKGRLLWKMPPKSEPQKSASGKLTKEEERLLLESSKHVTGTTSALFYGNAFIVSILPICELINRAGVPLRL